MEQELQIFNHPQFGDVRAVTIDGDPWFVGKDVAAALGYSNSRKAILDHVDQEDKGVTKRDTLGGVQDVTIINESGVYSLVFSSRLEGAKEFKHWVTSEVLPSIRKNGAYLTPQVQDHILNNPDFLISLANKIKEEQQRNRVLQEENKRIQTENDSLRPKARFADAVASSETDILVGELAKLLRQNGIDVGQNRLYKILREREYLCKQKGTMWNMPTQRALERGLFRVSESTVSKADGTVLVTRTTRVTGKGQTYFLERFLNGTLSA